MSYKTLALTGLLGMACLPKQGLETSLVVESEAQIEYAPAQVEVVQTEQNFDWMLEEDAATLGTTVEKMDAGVGAPALYLTSLLQYSLALKKNVELLNKASDKLRLHAPNSSSPLSCRDYFTVDRLVDDQASGVYDNNELIRSNSEYFNSDNNDLHLENLANVWQRRFSESKTGYRQARRSFQAECGDNPLLE